MTTTGPIARRVEQMQTAMADRMSSAALDTVSSDRARLAAVGVPDGLRSAGTVLPDLALIDVHGERTSLYAVTEDRPTVLILYRGAWCPYCNVALATYQHELVPGLAERGVGLLAASPQTPDGSLSMQEKNDLAFTVVSDPGNTIARQLGVLTDPSDEILAMQRGNGLDLRTVNADGTTALPMPTAAILDAAHVLRWMDVHADYSTRTEPLDILSALDELGL